MPHIPHPENLHLSPFPLIRAIGGAFLQPSVLTALAVLTAVAVFSAVVYMALEGWNFLDALYFCVVTMSTVGYGDITPKTDPGKIYTIGFLFIGIGIFVLTVTAIANAIFTLLRANEGVHVPLPPAPPAAPPPT